jgi:arsenate reductase
MTLTIYHNPRCSKSRQTLELIRSTGVEPEIIRYLDDTPSPGTILGLADSLGLRVADLLRRKESEFQAADDLPDLDDNEALARWLADHPKVIERPIVVDADSGRAVLGRPPENVKELLS